MPNGAIGPIHLFRSAGVYGHFILQSNVHVYIIYFLFRMNRIEPGEYSFMPKTWVLPQEHGFFLNYARRANDRGIKPTFILKPANGAMGHG